MTPTGSVEERVEPMMSLWLVGVSGWFRGRSVVGVTGQGCVPIMGEDLRESLGLFELPQAGKVRCHSQVNGISLVSK